LVQHAALSSRFGAAPATGVDEEEDEGVDDDDPNPNIVGIWCVVYGQTERIESEISIHYLIPLMTGSSRLLNRLGSSLLVL
jgi:hypothetical protein